VTARQSAHDRRERAGRRARCSRRSVSPTPILKKAADRRGNTWIEIGPCNYHLRDLAVHVKAGIRAAGGTPMEFNTVSISDGITMGTEGMRASLVSRK
jgi:dihydroxy-acid dehydratase